MVHRLMRTRSWFAGWVLADILFRLKADGI
jgi:hypothetical protein